MTASPVPIVVPKEFPQDRVVKIVKWLKRNQSPVSSGEPLVEIEFSKATIEIRASASGFLNIIAPAQSRVSVEEMIGTIESEPSSSLLQSSQRSSPVSLSSLSIVCECKEIISSLKRNSFSEKQLAPVLFKLLVRELREEDIHLRSSIEGFERVTANLGIVFAGKTKTLIYSSNEIVSLPVDKVEKWLLRHAVRAQKDEIENSNCTVSISYLLDQNIFTFNPAIAENQTMTVGIGGDLNIKEPIISINCSFITEAHKGFIVAKMLSKLRRSLLELSIDDKILRLLN